MKKKVFCILVTLGTLFFLAACGTKKDPFAGKTWEGFMFMRTTLEFGNDNSVVVNLGVIEDENGIYSFDEKEGTMVITLDDYDPLNFTYDSTKKVLQLNDEGWIIDYKLEK